MIGKLISKIASEAEDMSAEDDNWLAMVLLAGAIAGGLIEIVEEPAEAIIKTIKHII